MSRRAIRLTLQVALSAAALAIVFWQVDLVKTLDALQDLDPAWAFAAVVLNTATTWLYALRWDVLLRAVGQRQPFNWLTGTTFVSMLFGQALPSAVGADAVRAIELGRRTGQGAEALSSVVVDRAVGLVGVIALAAAGLALGGGGLDGGSLALSAAVLVLTCAVSAYLVFAPGGRRLLRPLVPVARRLRVEGPLRALYEALHAYRRVPGALAWVLVLAIVVQILRAFVVALLAEGLGLDVPLGAFLLLVPVVFLVTSLPLSLNGIGVREAAFAVVLSGSDVPEDQAVALGVAFFAVSVVTALGGGVVLLWRAVR